MGRVLVLKANPLLSRITGIADSPDQALECKWGTFDLKGRSQAKLEIEMIFLDSWTSISDASENCEIPKS
jgi:hypothetical protein